MKLGSIVGIVVSCLLIIGGIVMCAIGTATAEDNGQFLFTQINKDGTYYNQKIAEGTKRLKISYENAEIQIIGGAERSQIEFRNFNPNMYSLSVTPTVITFEEMQDITSIVNILDNGINFKGLRYALDFRNDDYDDLPKSIVISIADDSDLKVIDISASKSSAEISDLTLDGDISLRIDSGVISIENLSTTSTLELNGNDIETRMNAISASTLRYTAKKSELKIENCAILASAVTVDEGYVDYNTTELLDGAMVAVSSENGSLTVNSVPKSEGIQMSLAEYTKSLTIKCIDASINLTYPEAPVGEDEGGADTTGTSEDPVITE